MLQLAFVGILCPPNTNSERDDLYLLTANKVNELDEQGRITPVLERYGVLYLY
jgi:hypothetical protein